ncbi:MAG: glycine/sarcosine/betaine reductase selenoprotein B family protein [bacterium]
MTAQMAKAQVAAEQASAEQEAMGDYFKSFAYGSRTDLMFKFLKNMPAADAGEFVRGLLEKLGETIDDGDLPRLLDHVFEWNVRGYENEHEDPWRYDEGPFTPLAKPLADCTVGLLTASGHFVAGDDPEPFGEKNMTQAQAIPRIQDFMKIDAILSTIPVDTPRENLRVRHPGYDIRGSLNDHNVTLPLDAMAACAREGVIGEFLGDAFSFVGATAQTPLQKRHAPGWAEMLKERQVDAMLLVPV